MRRDLHAPIMPAPLPDGVALVPFSREVAPACHALMDVVYADGFGGNRPYAEWWTWLTENQFADYAPQHMYVARSGDGIVGFCHGWEEPFIKDLVVAGAWRKRGLGSALLTSALEGYRAAGAASVDLKTDVDNVTAQSLYRRLGFSIVERIDP